MFKGGGRTKGCSAAGSSMRLSVETPARGGEGGGGQHRYEQRFAPPRGSDFFSPRLPSASSFCGVFCLPTYTWRKEWALIGRRMDKRRMTCAVERERRGGVCVRARVGGEAKEG
jgi:hypothetical protein